MKNCTSRSSFQLDATLCSANQLPACETMNLEFSKIRRESCISGMDVAKETVCSMVISLLWWQQHSPRHHRRSSVILGVEGGSEKLHLEPAPPALPTILFAY